MMTQTAVSFNENDYRLNKRINFLICSLIFVLGICSFIVSAHNEGENFLLAFRYMTVNGTLFTTIVAPLVAVINLLELKNRKEYNSRGLYYLRLSSAVTESVIAIVIAMSFLPFIPDSPNIFTFDSFNMHVIIPALAIVSFLTDNSPVETKSHLRALSGSWLITAYGAVVITMIFSGFISYKDIPYSFLKFSSYPVWYYILFGVLIYAISFLLSWLYTVLNQKIVLSMREKKVSNL